MLQLQTPLPDWIKQPENYENKRWVIDSETDGLEANKLWIVVLKDIDGVGERAKPVVFDGVNIKPKSILCDILAKAKLIVGHNAIDFDHWVLEKHLDIIIPRSKVWDTLVLSRLANSARFDIKKAPHSIEAWGQRFGLHKVEHEDWSEYSMEMQVRCIKDVEIGHLTLKRVLAELKGFSKDSIQNELDLAWFLRDMNDNGFWLDREKAMNLFTNAKEKADELQRRVRERFRARFNLVGEVNPRYTKDGQVNKTYQRGFSELGQDVCGSYSRIELRDFNIDSPAQRVERLLESGWKPQKFTEAGNPQFDADDLENDPNLPDEAKFLGTYLMCRSRERTVRQWLEASDENGYVRGKVFGIGAWSHRASHSNPNMANIPKVKKGSDKQILYGLDGGFGFECRDCWGVEPRLRDDYIQMGADLSAIQLRALAHYIGDLDYCLKVSDPNFDLHELHAGYLGGVKRDIAKRWLYAWLLGAGTAKLGSILGGTEEDGRISNENFLRRIPGLKILKENVIPSWVRDGYMVGLDGRRVPVLSKHLALTSALQSFEKIVMSHSMVGLDKLARMWDTPFIPMAWVHDEIQSLVAKDQAERMGNAFKQIVSNVGKKFKSLTPLAAECQFGYTWASCH